MPRKYEQLDKKIQELLESKGPMTSAQVASRLDISPKLAYQRCVYIEEHGDASHKTGPGERVLYYSPVTRSVVTETTGPILGELKKRIRDVPIQDKKELTDHDKAELRKVFDQFWSEQRARATPEQRAQLDTFERQLLAVMAGTSLRSLIGLAPFHPPVRYFAGSNYDWPDEWPPGNGG